MLKHCARFCLPFVLIVSGAAPASAQSAIFPKTSLAPQVSYRENDPVVMAADRMDYDQENAVITATGAVEIAQGDTIITADRLVYEQKQDRVTAQGNVSMLEPSGNVYFADELELVNNMKAGAVEAFKARLVDESLFAAAHAKKIDENVIELDQAVYSPCKVTCSKEGEGKSPMWQLKADHVKIDNAEQLVTYDNVRMEAYGLPVFYSPYLSHATPGADNKSGLLTPEFKQNSSLGSILKAPVYYTIAPDKDITLTPIYTTQEGLVMGGEYRQKFDAGDMAFRGSITRPEDRNALGLPDSGRQIRGHIDGSGAFALSPDARWGFDLRRTTDDTYLRRYQFSQDTLLTSSAFIETTNVIEGNDRNYASARALSFQGLTAEDDSERIPIVLPLAEFSYESDPMRYNSRYFMGSNLMALTRDTGAKSRRLSMTGGWTLPYITNDGQIVEFSTQLRGDIYSVEDVLLAGGRQFDGTTGRLIPEASATWRYPFFNRIDEQTSLMIEPVVSAAISPGGGNPEKIPNEDSLVPEFTDGNLFSPNRYAGYDRVETGPRVSYGLRGQVQLFSDKYVDWLFGQHYQTDPDRFFPFSNDRDSHFSDYVGKLGLHYLPFDIAYRFRLDKDDLSSKRNEVDATFTRSILTLSATYLSLQNDPVLATKEEISGSATLALTPEWQLILGGRSDLELNFVTSTSAAVVYKNECTYFTGVIGKEYTRDRDVEPATTFLFQVAFKNLE